MKTVARETVKFVKRAIKDYGRGVDGSTARIAKTDPVLHRKLTKNALLNKTATMAAKRDLLLKSNVPAGIINAKVKPLSRELQHVTKRVRRGPTGGLGGQMEDEEEEDDDALVTGPIEQWFQKMIKATSSKKEIKKEIEKEVKKEIKRPASGEGMSRILVRTVKSKPSGSRGVITPVTPQLEELRKRREALEKRLEETVKRRRQTEVERLRSIPGWTTWDKPVKCKLKDDL